MKVKRFHKNYSNNQERYKRHSLTTLAVFTFLIVLIVAAILWVRWDYDANLKPVSSSQTINLLTVPTGDSVSQIASLLKQQKLIRNTLVFEEYVNNSNSRTSLQAGTYALSQSLSVQQIVNILTKGTVYTKLVTILPGLRIDQIRADLINGGFSPNSVDTALSPAEYSSLPIMSFVPAGSSLEGLLYPDSFQKNSDTDPSVIISESLTEMGQKLSPSLQAAFAKEGLTTYQGIVLASIVEKEVSSASDQAQAAQVFLSRLAQDMPLESNVTAYYGCILNNQPLSTTFDTPYNTYLHTGLPPTPISNVDSQALDAIAHPASTIFLYFVTGKNGVTYFSQTLQEQQANIAQYGQATQ